MANWNAYPLHPQSPYYGWQGNWGSSYISMYNGQCSISFSLFLTAPDNPETTPANMPAKKATQRWYWDLSSWGPQYEPEWGAIKKYAPDGRYDYEYVLQQYNLNAVAITSINRSITKPSYQPLINPATYFVTGYQTTMYDWISPWHKRPWPGYSGWGSLSAPIMINGERGAPRGRARAPPATGTAATCAWCPLRRSRSARRARATARALRDPRAPRWVRRIARTVRHE